MEFAIVISSTNKNGLEDKLIVLSQKEEELKEDIIQRCNQRIDALKWHQKLARGVLNKIVSQSMDEAILEFKKETIKM